MTIDPQSLYVQLGRLLEAMPADLGARGPMPTSVLQWLGRGSALLQASGDEADIKDFQHAVGAVRVARELGDGDVSRSSVQMIAMVLHRALAKAELNAPSTAQGSFIPAGNSFDALVAVDKVLKQGKRNVLIVDPYMDEKALTQFAVLTPEGVQIRLLADRQYCKESLKPAMIAWKSQHGGTRPLEARLTPPRALHDRLIAVDGTEAFTLTQSLNSLAARSPASIVRVDAETAALKIAAYEDLWAAATPV